jgi:hypothetical protein
MSQSSHDSSPERMSFANTRGNQAKAGYAQVCAHMSTSERSGTCRIPPPRARRHHHFLPQQKADVPNPGFAASSSAREFPRSSKSSSPLRLPPSGSPPFEERSRALLDELTTLQQHLASAARGSGTSPGGRRGSGVEGAGAGGRHSVTDSVMAREHRPVMEHRHSGTEHQHSETDFPSQGQEAAAGARRSIG